jgi:hypothetical protein
MLLMLLSLLATLGVCCAGCTAFASVIMVTQFVVFVLTGSMIEQVSDIGTGTAWSVTGGVWVPSCSR